MASGSSPWEQLQHGVSLPFLPGLEVPALTEVEIDVPRMPPVVDVEKTAQAEVEARFAASVTPGMTVAVGGGSRGLHRAGRRCCAA